MVWSPGIRTWPFRAMADLVQRMRRRLRGEKALSSGESVTWAIRNNEPTLMFARQRFRFGRIRRRDPLERIIRSQQELGSELRFVPIVIAWQRVPVKLRRSLWDRFFGQYDSPGRLRELLNFMGNPGHALVRVGTPIDSSQLTGGQPDLQRAVSKVRYTLNRYFINENRVIRGPIGKTAAQTITEMLRQGVRKTPTGDCG